MHKILLALLITKLLTGAAADAVPPARTQPTNARTESVVTVETSPPTPVIRNGGPDEIELVEEAVRKFADHGMLLPAVEITFADTREACDGFRGLYEQGFGPTGDPADQITICDDWPVYLYHELAHAWEAHSITATTRAELLDHWHLDTWSDQDEQWDARGIEQAAKAISYTFAFDALPDDLDVSRYVCAFEILTGVPLPIDVPVSCDTDTDTVVDAEVDGVVDVEIGGAPAADTAPAHTWTEKDPTEDPRLAPTTTAVSPVTETDVSWSWEHDGPGSNSLDAPWLTATDEP